jgi:hypothetical protein
LWVDRYRYTSESRFRVLDCYPFRMPVACLHNGEPPWHVTLPKGGERQQSAPLLATQLGRHALRRAVHPYIGCVAQPLARLQFGRCRVHLEPERTPPAIQRNSKAVAHPA